MKIKEIVDAVRTERGRRTKRELNQEYYQRPDYKIKNRLRYHTDPLYRSKAELRNEKAAERRKEFKRNEYAQNAERFIDELENWGSPYIGQNDLCLILHRGLNTLKVWVDNGTLPITREFQPSPKNRNTVVFSVKEIISFAKKNKEFIGNVKIRTK